MPLLSENLVERLDDLKKLLEEEKFKEVITECISVSSLVRQDDNYNKQLESILLEIQIKAHLQLDQLQEVIELGSKQQQSEDDDNNFVQPLVAYAQYRLKNYSEAKKNSGQKSVLAQHVLAQSLYRSGETKLSWKTYNSVSEKNDDDSERVQILTNALAVRNANANPYGFNDLKEDNELVRQAQELFSKEMSTNGSIPFDMYEMAYNLGTYKLLFTAVAKKGKGAAMEGEEEGENILKAAEQAIREDGGDEEEESTMMEDLSPVLTNLAWSRQKCHSLDDALDYPMDAEATKFVTTHNISLIQENNAAINKKKEVALPVSSTPLQRRLYHYNQAILALRRKQHAVVKKQLQLLQQCISGDSKKNTSSCASSDDLEFWKSRAVVLEAYSLQQNGKEKEAKQLLKKQQASSDSISAAWLQLHLKRMEGELDSPQDTLNVLETCLPSSLRSKPAVLATRAMLYQKLGKEVPKELAVDDTQRGELLFSQGNYEEALPYFESAQKSDSQSFAKYILCLTYTDPDKANELANNENNDFLELDADSSLNADALEAREIPRLKKSSRSNTKSTTTTDNVSLSASNTPRRNNNNRESIMKQRAKKRETYLEKLRERHIDTTKQKPDPERWLPKHERSNNRNRRRKQQQQQHRGAQGGYSQAEAAKPDVANRASAPSAKSTAHMTVVGGEYRRRR